MTDVKQLTKAFHRQNIIRNIWSDFVRIKKYLWLMLRVEKWKVGMDYNGFIWFMGLHEVDVATCTFTYDFYLFILLYF